MRNTRLLTGLLVATLLGALLAPAAGPAVAVTEAGRGIASRDADITTSDIGRLKAAGASWTYAWRYRKIPARQPGFDVVPMIRTASAILPDTVEVLTEAKAAGTFKYLLGFNEPDNAGQADLTPTQAANLWPKLQKTGLVLGSPAPAHPTNGWLKQFMAIAKKRNLRVDFIALHFYANITDTKAVARIKKQVQAVRKAYGRTIWITELGIIDNRTKNIGSPATNWARATTFLRAVDTMLDSLPYVQRVAWVTDQISANQKHLKWSKLANTDGSLTPLGKAYDKLD